MSQIPEPSSGDLAHAKPMPHWPKLPIHLPPERTKEKSFVMSRASAWTKLT